MRKPHRNPSYCGYYTISSFRCTYQLRISAGDNLGSIAFTHAFLSLPAIHARSLIKNINYVLVGETLVMVRLASYDSSGTQAHFMLRSGKYIPVRYSIGILGLFARL